MLVRRKLLLALTVLACTAMLAACSPDESTENGPLKQDGTPSREFERDNLEDAAEAGLLVRIYCSGTASEAQETGCRAHVDDSTICSYTTPTAINAVAEYTRQTGDDPC